MQAFRSCMLLISLFLLWDAGFRTTPCSSTELRLVPSSAEVCRQIARMGEEMMVR